MHHYNKLVRDKVPENLQKKGTPMKYHVAVADEEYWYLLKQKLQEEVTELNDRSDAEAIIDILDVIDAMIVFKDFDPKQIAAVRENKAIEHGKFGGRMVLDQSDEEVGHAQSQAL